jgi:hypothetical protein
LYFGGATRETKEIPIGLSADFFDPVLAQLSSRGRLQQACSDEDLPSQDPGEDRTLPSVTEEPDPFGSLLCPGRAD